MPVSTSIHLSHCLQRIVSIRPESVLDVGCGFGLWGFLCREYLDAWHGRISRSEWEVRIDGIEVFEPYIQALQRAVYSNILVEDIREAVKHIDEYDLIIAGDVIEHLDKPDGEAVVEALYDKARKALLINIPLDDGWDHPEAHGNPAELHRSQWNPDDLVQYPGEFTRFSLPCGDYGVFWCFKDIPAGLRAEGLAAAAEMREKRGEPESALRLLLQACDLEPASQCAVVPLTNFLIERGKTSEAVGHLRHAVETDPTAHWARLLLARVMKATSRHAEANEELRVLLEQPEVPQDIATAARELKGAIQKRFA
ncbi:MAG TPA: tetratricopeptide repeat protein [Candidatus Bathyarchaeia archaeon]|nr:tetratricopeptide repeat protein [Candidatus Bathyarchaeia archaeon]